MDNIFEVIMFLVVVGSYAFRFIKGRKDRVAKSTLASFGSVIGATVDRGGEGISGFIDDIPFSARYRPDDETGSARVELRYEKELPFIMEIAPKGASDLGLQEPDEGGSFSLGDATLDQAIQVTTEDEKACREFLRDPIFRGGVELLIREGCSVRFRRKHAVVSMPGTDWMQEANAAKKLQQMLQVGHCLIGEF